MKKFIILILAALLPVVATAADTDTGSPTLTKKEQRRTLRGYKGFVELGAGITLHDYDFWFSLDDDRPKGFGMDLLTTHGFQFNNFIFLGGGVGLSGCTEKSVMMPMFVNIRINMLNRRISPVIDMKGGYAVGDRHGGYLAVAAGMRFGLKGNTKSAVYTEVEASWLGDTERGLYFGRWDLKNRRCGRFMFRVGYEF